MRPSPKDFVTSGPTRFTRMNRKLAALMVLAVVLPAAALADSDTPGRVVNRISALPEYSSLGLLGSGLIGFAVLLRRRLRLVSEAQLVKCV